MAYPKNRKPGAGFSNKGIVRSLEFREKVSRAMKGRIFTEEHRANLRVNVSLAMRGT